MTGTSCDGADLALLRLERRGNGWSESLLRCASRKIPSPLRAGLREAQKGDLGIRRTASLTRDYSRWIARFCDQVIRSWRINPENLLLAIHGQTVWHEPPKFSVQLLDPAIPANETSCTVTYGFRQPDLARGGQGAPLVPYYHWLRAHGGSFSKALPFAVHNVGGIANLTAVTHRREDMLAFDTGPGNALIDLAVEKISRGRIRFDAGGRIASEAYNTVNWKKIERLAAHPFFRKKPPKSTGRELFNEEFLRRIPGRGPALVANATAFTAHTMARAYVDFVFPKLGRLKCIFMAGGGAHNPTLMLFLFHELARLARFEQKIPVLPLPVAFAPPQYLEAMAFARLGFEALQGNPVSLAKITGASEDAYGAGIIPGANFGALLKQLNMG